MDVPLALAAALTLVVCGAVARSGFGARLLAAQGSRMLALDGLRGLAALLVAIHHLAYLTFWRAGIWNLGAGEQLANRAGPLGVSLFFLLCACLFWARLPQIAARGPAGWRDFAVNRVRRIVPMYVVAMTMVVAILGLLARAGDPWLPWPALLRNVASVYTFGFVMAEGVNGSYLGGAAANVSWTLRYEWLFYLSLPLLGLVRRHWTWPVTLVAVLLLAERVWQMPFVGYFVYGCLVQAVSTLPAVRRLAPGWAGTVISIGALAAVMTWGDARDLGLGWEPLALALCFLPVAAGNDWHGLLSSRGARLVGACSYSLYLTNLVVGSILVYGLPVRPLPWPPGMQAGWFTLVLSAMVGLSLLTYRWVEWPFQQHRPPNRGSGPAMQRVGT